MTEVTEQFDFVLPVTAEVEPLVESPFFDDDEPCCGLSLFFSLELDFLADVLPLFREIGTPI